MDKGKEVENWNYIDFDDINNKHRLRRKHNSTSAATHAAGTLISKLESEFTYEVSNTPRSPATGAPEEIAIKPEPGVSATSPPLELEPTEIS